MRFLSSTDIAETDDVARGLFFLTPGCRRESHASNRPRYQIKEPTIVPNQRIGNRRSARGFTLVELLVVIAIIGVLVALLLPAIQAAREAARKTSCSNNLKQIGLGLINYESTNKTLPFGSGYITAPTGTWASAILPFIEEQNHYDLFNFNVYLDELDNREAVTTVVDTYVCPSDNTEDIPWANGPILGQRRNQLAGAHNPADCMGLWYPACMGPTEPDFCTFGADPVASPYNPTCQGCNFGTSNGSRCQAYRGEPFAGLIARDVTSIPFRRVTDGLSNTIMAAETLPGHCVWNGAFMSNFPVASTHIPINTMISDGGVPQDYWLTSGYKSRHPGGANFAMADGSVHFVSETIDYLLYNALGTRAGGETASLDNP